MRTRRHGKRDTATDAMAVGGLGFGVYLPRVYPGNPILTSLLASTVSDATREVSQQAEGAKMGAGASSAEKNVGTENATPAWCSQGMWEGHFHFLCTQTQLIAPLTHAVERSELTRLVSRVWACPGLGVRAGSCV